MGGGGNRESKVSKKYLEAKNAVRTVYSAKCKTEREKFGNVIQRDDQKYDVFKIVKRMVKTNRDIIDEQCIRSDDGVLAVSD